MKQLMEHVFGENYGNLFKVRVDGRDWYLAKSVCGVLGLSNTSVAIKGGSTRIGYFGIDQKDIYKLGSYKNSPLYITEAGVWKLTLKSRKPAATIIKRILSEKVLVEIMRTGSYQGT
jgi:anti-repressor protein